MSNKENWKERECGCLWRNGDGDSAYYSGEVTIAGQKQRIVIYRNKFKKEGTKEADLRIYTDKPKS